MQTMLNTLITEKFLLNVSAFSVVVPLAAFCE